MFSSITTSTNSNKNTTCTITSLNMSPFPQYYFPSSSSPSPTYLQPPQILPLSSSLVLTNQDHHNNNIFLPQNYPYDLDHYQTLFLTNTTTNNHPAPTIPSPIPAPKKDHHSKIQTAQGLRDRRVRLSIDIAREFFDLHDLLGFDKASKTLQWLLLKSRKAIKDLSASKRTASSYNNPADDSECDQAVSELNELGHSAAIDQVDELGDPSASKSVADAKESRAKARARARAMTKEKKRSHCNNNNGKNVVASTAQQPIIPISYAAAEASDDRHGVVVKRNKLFKFQNNDNHRAIASKEESFNNNNDSSDNVIHSSSSSSSNLYLLPANILGHQFYGNLSRTDAI